MRSYVAVLVLVVSAASAGCGSTPPRGGDDEPEDVLQGPDFGGFEVDTGTAGDTGGQQDVADAGQLDAVSDRTSDTTPSDVSEAEGARAMGLAWCLPEAVPYDLSGLPPLPVGFDPDTYCSATSVSPAGERAPTHRHVFDPETRTLTVTASELMGPGDSVVRYELDGAGRVRSMYRRGQEGWYSVGVGETWYDLTVEGELERKVATLQRGLEGSGDTTETVQVWAEGADRPRLRSRETRTGEDGPVLQRWTWDYDDDDRLLRAAREDVAEEHTRVYESVWTYGPEGLPASVERRIDGVVVGSETWHFDGDQTLLERSYDSRAEAALVAAHGGTEQEWTFPPGLDTYHAPVGDVFMDNPWPHALPRESGECHLIPHGPGHGYPDGESEYQLGVPASERPAGIGFAYANDSYGWAYGDLAWYGHDALGSSWLGVRPNDWGVSIEVDVVYEAGLMSTERATVTLADGSSTTMDRTRSLDEAYRVASDRVTASSSDDEHTRELRFARDERGHLVERTLWIEGAAWGHQAWEHDSVGRALTHEVLAGEQLPVPADSDWLEWLHGFGHGEVTPTEWYWRYQGDHLVERGGGTNELLEVFEYDARGLVVSSEGTFGPFEANQSQRWTYDDAERVVEHCSSYDDDMWTCTNTTFDPAGRVGFRSNTQSDGDPVVFEFHEYTCSP